MTAPIQEGVGNNQEGDFLRTHHPIIPCYGSSGRLHHVQNDFREASSGRSRETVIPMIQDEEVDQVMPIVKDRLQESCNKFPMAHGLVVAFSNDVGCENTHRIPNIHSSSKNVCRSFSKKGYAHCIFTQCRTVEILAVYHQLSRMEFPSSYKAIFIYFTGHGKNYYISATDGYISINHLKYLLSATNAPNLRNVVKVLFFDCCRTRVTVENMRSSPSEENLMVVYMVPLGQRSFIVNDAGMSVGTITLVQLVDTMEHCSLVSLFSEHLCRGIKTAVRNTCNEPIDLRTDFEGSLCRNIDLYDDMMKARSPIDVKLTEDCEHDVCTLTWQKPLHADYHQLINFYVAFTRINRPIDWKILRDGKEHSFV